MQANAVPSFQWTNLSELHAQLPSIEHVLAAQTSHQPAFAIEMLETYQKHYGFAGLLSTFDAVHKPVHLQGLLNIESNQIFVQCFLQATSKAQGTVFIHHGYLDHLGLYTFTIQLFLELGYQVVGYDLPGHGLSSGPRGSIDTFEVYAQVHDQLIMLIKNHDEIFPKPLIGFGQSTGCAVMMQSLLKKPPSQYKHIYDGLIFLAPLIRTSKWYYTKLLYFFLKHKGSIPRTFKNNSSDIDFVDFLKNHDPLQYRKIEAKWVGAMMKYVNHITRCQQHPLTPLVIQGDLDETVSFHFNMKALRKLFTNPTQIQISNAAHHLVNESKSIKDEIRKYIIEHLNSKI